VDASVPRGWVAFNEEPQRLFAAPELGSLDSSRRTYAVGDVDGDGDEDIVCVRSVAWLFGGRQRNVLFLNEGIAEGHAFDGVLVDRSTEFASLGPIGSHGFLDATADRNVVLADINNDGWLDVITCVADREDQPRLISHPRVFHNLGRFERAWQGFQFEPESMPPFQTIPEGISQTPRFCGAAAGDVTGDGFADLYFTECESGPQPFADLNDRLLINDGNGAFLDSGHERLSASMLDSQHSTSVAIVDLNGDGTADIVKSELFGETAGVVVAYNDPRNVGFFSHTEIVFHGPVTQLASVDLTLDDRMDILVSSDRDDLYLFNIGNGPDGFADFEQRLFLLGEQFDEGFGGKFNIADLNLDGLPDVLIADTDELEPGCLRSLRAYRHLGGIPASLQVQLSGPLARRGVHDSTCADLNRDGWPDLVMATCDGTQVWINDPASASRIAYPEGIPGYLRSGFSNRVRVDFQDSPAGPPVPGSVRLHSSIDGAAFIESSSESLGHSLFEIPFPSAGCGARIEWYVTAESSEGKTIREPRLALSSANESTIAASEALRLWEDFEDSTIGWIVVNQDVSFGGWVAVDPRGTVHLGGPAAPEDDAGRNPQEVTAFVTGNGLPGGTAPQSDLDGGPTRLISPRIDLAGGDAMILWDQWFYCDDEGTSEADLLTADVSNDDGSTWVNGIQVSGTSRRWMTAGFRVGRFVSPTDRVRVRFTTSDQPNNSVTEAGIDRFRVREIDCGDPSPSPALIGSDPPDSAIDARQPGTIDGTVTSGWHSLDLLFDADPSNLTMSDFQVTQMGGLQSPPVVLELKSIGGNRLRLTFNRALEPISWTIVDYAASMSRIRIGYLPGDVNGDGVASPLDILALIDALNGVGTARPSWSTDIDRSNATGPADVLREVDLLNGAGAFEPYAGRALP